VDASGISVPGYIIEPLRGLMSYAVLSGRAPSNGSEVAAGPATLKALRARLGDEVQLNGQAFRVVGSVLLLQTPHTSFDQGVWLSRDGFVRIGADVDAEEG